MCSDTSFEIFLLQMDFEPPIYNSKKDLIPFWWPVGFTHFFIFLSLFFLHSSPLHRLLGPQNRLVSCNIVLLSPFPLFRSVSFLLHVLSIALGRGAETVVGSNRSERLIAKILSKKKCKVQIASCTSFFTLCGTHKILFYSYTLLKVSYTMCIQSYILCILHKTNQNSFFW